MKIEKLLIIPNREQLSESMALAKQYGCGFEYNDFFWPAVLDDDKKIREFEELYTKEMRVNDELSYCTMHGAFFDVTIFSDDEKIRQVSDLRVEQSLQIAKKMGAKAVVFHTNYVANFLTDFYRDNWVSRNERYWREKAAKYPELNIYMENMFDTDWVLLACLGKELQDVPNFGICFDYAHAHVFGEPEDIHKWVTELAPYVKHVHINDNDFISDSHLGLGEGQIDWQRFKHYYENCFPEASVLVEMTGNQRIESSLEFLKNL